MQKRQRQRTLTHLRAFLVALGLVLGGVVGIATPAQATTPAFQMPFPCGEVWNASTYSGHGAAIDWNAYPGDDNGRLVVASAAGTASLYYESIGGYQVIIDHGNGWKTVYAHLQQLGRASGAVVMGSPIGYVGSSGSGVTGAHLHWEQIYNGVKQAPLKANGSALSPGTFPASNAYTSNNCAPTAPPVTPTPQFIVQRQGVNVYAKAGFADAWSHLASNAIDVQVAETRIVTRDVNHTIYGKEGIGGPWYTLADDVDEYAVSSNLVVIREGTKVSAKADLWGPWVQIANDAIDIQVAGTRIGHRDANHELYMNDGLYGPWYHVASNVDEYKLSPSLIVQRQGANVYAKAGFADAWSHLASNAIDIQVSGNRIANRDAAHNLYVKDGIGGTWYTVASNVDEFDLTPDLIVQRQDTAIFGKTGPTTAWVQIANDAIDIQAAGTRIGHRNTSHQLYMNDGLTGPWYSVASNVDEFDLS